MKFILFFLVTIGIMMFTGFSKPFPERPITGFWAMEGTLITHYFEDQTDSLSGPEIFELQNEDGLTIWFGRHIFKDVCKSGECKMISLWLFWDGVGNYLGMHIPENEPLTKSDHTKFAPEDFYKLDGILRDTASILKSLKQEDLVFIPDSIDPYEAYKVDGYTAATQPALADVVVKNAVYTCYTLWHTVYGPVQKAIFEILEDRLDNDFLTLMFNNPNLAYHFWAISSVEKFPEYHNAFYQQIIENIKSENTALANKALNYFKPEILTDAVIQKQLVNIMPNVEMNIKYEILWKFIGLGEVNDNVAVGLLNLYKEKSLGVGMLNLIFRLISEEHLEEDKEIYQIIKNLTNDENQYVRNLSQRLLDNKGTSVSN